MTTVTLPSYPESSNHSFSALAFDFGTQRIGVAFGQSVSGTAAGVTVVKAKDGIPDWDELSRLIEQWQPDVLVIGLPFNMDGSESELLARAVKFANRLHGRFHRPVYGMDERLSSQEAIEQVIDSRGGNKKDKAIDDIAARIILENWFNGLSAKTTSVKNSN